MILCANLEDQCKNLLLQVTKTKLFPFLPIKFYSRVVLVFRAFLFTFSRSQQLSFLGFRYKEKKKQRCKGFVDQSHGALVDYVMTFMDC